MSARIVVYNDYKCKRQSWEAYLVDCDGRKILFNVDKFGDTRGHGYTPEEAIDELKKNIITGIEILKEGLDTIPAQTYSFDFYDSAKLYPIKRNQKRCEESRWGGPYNE